VALRGFERRLENMVEGTFSRVFRSGLRPVEVGRRLTREMDANRSVDVNGRVVVPNDFVIWMSPGDHEQFSQMEQALVLELCEAAREHARDEVYGFVGPVRVDLQPWEKLRTGTFQIEAKMAEGTGGVGAGSLLLPTNQRIPLSEQPVVIGRAPECNIQLGDTNVSRKHAEIRPRGTGYVLVDLNSTNGVRVNGLRVAEQVLVDGDEILIGNTRMIFEAS
jgi:Protein of unknown function (DUF3662)/FHA domain